MHYAFQLQWILSLVCSLIFHQSNNFQFHKAAENLIIVCFAILVSLPLTLSLTLCSLILINQLALAITFSAVSLCLISVASVPFQFPIIKSFGNPFPTQLSDKHNNFTTSLINRFRSLANKLKVLPTTQVFCHNSLSPLFLFAATEATLHLLLV